MSFLSTPKRVKCVSSVAESYTGTGHETTKNIKIDNDITLTAEMGVNEMRTSIR